MAVVCFRRIVQECTALQRKKPFLVVCNKCDQTPQNSLLKVDALWQFVREHLR